MGTGSQLMRLPARTGYNARTRTLHAFSCELDATVRFSDLRTTSAASRILIPELTPAPATGRTKRIVPQRKTRGNPEPKRGRWLRKVGSTVFSTESHRSLFCATSGAVWRLSFESLRYGCPGTGSVYRNPSLLQKCSRPSLWSLFSCGGGIGEGEKAFT